MSMKNGVLQKVTWLQLFLLKITGVLVTDTPGPKNLKRPLQILITVLSGLWLIGCWVSFCLNAGIAVASLSNPDPSLAYLSSTMQAFVMLPYAAYSFRGSVAVTILISKRRAWKKSYEKVNTVIEETFGDSAPVRKWMIFSGTVVGVTTVLLILWEVLYVYQTFDLYDFTLWSPGILKPLPIDQFQVWQYIVLWTCCSTLPFYISQQILGCLMVMGEVLNDCATKLNQELKEASSKLEKLSEDPKKFYNNDAYSGWLAETAVARVIALKRRFLDINRFCHYFNTHLGSVVFFIYGADLLTLFGSLAGIMTAVSERNTLPIRSFYYCSALFFLTYCTAFLWPLVRVYEQGLKVNYILHQFIRTLESQSAYMARQGRNLHLILRTFVSAARDHGFVFSGMEVWHVTRTFVFTTFTFMVSFIVIATEIFHREKLSEARQGAFQKAIQDNLTAVSEAVDLIAQH